MGQDVFNTELRRNHKWNTLMNVLDGVFFQIGFACFMPAVIIVAYLKYYTDNEMILNLPVFIANFAMALGPFVASFFSGRFKSKKKAVLIFGALQRVFFIPVILTVYFFNSSRTWVIPVFLTAYAVYYMVWASGVLFWQEMMGRIFVPEKLSSAMGIRESLSRVIGFFASLAVMLILAKVAFPGNFIVLLVTAFVSWNISLIWIFRMKEAPYEGAGEKKEGGHLKNLILLPVRDKAFFWYVVFILFLYGFLFVGSLYTVVGIERFSETVGRDRLTGIISIIITLSSCVFAFAGGKISEKLGKFWGFTVYVLVNILLPVGMVFCTNYFVYLPLMFFSGMVNTLWILEFTTVMGFAAPEKRHEYLAFISLVKLVPIVVYTNVGGFLANTFSKDIAFAASSVLSLLALLVLVFKLRPLWTASDKRRAHGMNNENLSVN